MHPTIIANDKELCSALSSVRDAISSSKDLTDMLYGDKGYHIGDDTTGERSRRIADGVSHEQMDDLVKRMEKTRKAIDDFVILAKGRGYGE